MRLVDADYIAYEEQLKEISEIEDYEQQGYLTAPIVSRFHDIAPEEMMVNIITALDKTNQASCHTQRDIGAIRWCLEQRAKP